MTIAILLLLTMLVPQPQLEFPGWLHGGEMTVTMTTPVVEVKHVD